MGKMNRERLKGLLHYNRTTGIWRWREKRNGIRPDMIAGSPNRDGYILIKIDGHSYKAHVLAVFYVTGEWPTSKVDHRNRTKSDNRWRNIRPATVAQNRANCRAYGKSGFKGVYKHTRKNYSKPYEASIRVDGNLHYLGRYKTAKQASAAYRVAAKQHFGEFARS